MYNLLIKSSIIYNITTSVSTISSMSIFIYIYSFINAASCCKIIPPKQCFAFQVDIQMESQKTPKSLLCLTIHSSSHFVPLTNPHRCSQLFLLIRPLLRLKLGIDLF